MLEKTTQAERRAGKLQPKKCQPPEKDRAIRDCIAQNAFGTVVAEIQPAIVTWNAGGRLARAKSVTANPEFCQRLQIALVST